MARTRDRQRAAQVADRGGESLVDQFDVELLDEDIDPVQTMVDMDVAPDVVAVEARTLVPTERQEVAGERRQEYSFNPFTEEQRRKEALGAKAKGFLSRVDPRALEGRKRPLIVFIILGMFTQLDEQVFANALPEMSSDFGENIAPLIALGNVILVVRLTLGPVFGYLSDRVRRVWMLRITMMLGQIGTMGAAFSSGFMQVMLGRSVGELMTHPTGGAAPVAQTNLLGDFYKPSAIARVTLTLRALSTLATLGSPLFAGWMIAVYGWRQALFTLGFIALIASTATFLLREPRRGALGRPEASTRRRRRRRAVEEDEVTSPAEAQSSPIPSISPVPFREAFRTCAGISTMRRIWMASAVNVVGSGGIYVFLSFFWAQQYGLDAFERGMILTATGFTMFLMPMLMAPVYERFMITRPGDIMRFTGTITVVQALLIVLMISMPTLWLALLFALPFHALWSLIDPARDMVMLRVLPSGVRGTGLQLRAWFEIPGSLFFAYLMAQGRTGGAPELGLFWAPFLLVAGFLLIRAGAPVESDVRRARATDLADELTKQAKLVGNAKLLLCRDVDVNYDGTQVLFGVDFEVAEGEMVALLGTNGAGKSTLLRAIAGSHTASNGAIFFDGRDVTHEPPHLNARAGIVTMPGGRATFPGLSVHENLRAAAWMYREDEAYVRHRMEEVFGFFPVLRERLGEAAGNLSGGEQQMVGLGQALLMRPRLLMIDELSLGLAPAVVEQLLEILKAIHAQGTTVLIVEQSVNVALTVAERAVFMDKGEIRFDGPTEELLARPDLVRSVFMGGAASARTSTRAAPTGADRVTAPDAVRLAVEDVGVSFGGIRALQGVDLTVEEGEVVGIIGPNGAGKTTLFDVVSGFVAPDEGRVVLGDTDLTALSPDARGRLGLGRSFQNVRLFPALTVRENIAVALEERAVKSKVLAAAWASPVRRSELRIKRRVDGLIEILGLEAFADKFAAELSTGSRRAVEVACIMAAEPKILLLDEPSSGLAQAETEELGPVLLRIVRDTGCGLLVIEHDLPLVTSVSDRLVAMELGQVIAGGTPDEVCADERVVSSYLAASQSVIARSGQLAGVTDALESATRAPDGRMSTDRPSTDRQRDRER